MIELKIPNATAVMLITERMKLEFDQRVKINKYRPESTIFTLRYEELLELAEASAIDLVFFLPAGIHYETNNLAKILCQAIRSLAPIYRCPDFTTYTVEQAERIVIPIQNLFLRSEKNNAFLRN